MSEASDVIHRGSKVFWKVRSTVDVVIVRHSKIDLLEVICTDPVRSRECGRLYVNESALRDRVAEKEFLADQKEHLSKKGPNQDGAMIPTGVEISTNETVNFILDRLHVESYDPKTRIFHIEMQEYLPTEEKSTDTAGAQLIRLKPASLIPYLGTTTAGGGDSGSNERRDSKVTTKPPTLTVETAEAPVVSPVTKSPKANVPRIELGQLTSSQLEKNTPGTTPPPHNGPKYHQNAQIPPQQVQHNNTSHLQIHTADSFEADFNVYHGRRDQNHRPFAAGGLNAMSNSNPNTARHNAYTPIASLVTSPVISPRTAASPPVLQFTPRKGKKNHVSILQSVHNTQNAQAAEARHARQQVHVNQSNLSHSVGSNHLAPIPLPDQLTKVTTHPTLPPNRNLTPHQEPYLPPEEKEKRKKKHRKSIRARIREAGAALGRFFGWRHNRKVYSTTHNSQEAVVPILNAHNEVLLVKSSEAQRHSSTASSESAASAAKVAVYNSSIPKHMQVPLHSPSVGSTFD